ncbi:MAG: hypothetical protein ACE5IP_13360 [Terriglobia bacterium]
MGKPVVHWEVWAADDNKLGKFYQELFDWKVNFVPGLNYHLFSK